MCYAFHRQSRQANDLHQPQLSFQPKVITVYLALTILCTAMHLVCWPPQMWPYMLCMLGRPPEYHKFDAQTHAECQTLFKWPGQFTSTRSWLRVLRVWFSHSLREAPTASISSMNTMHGAFFLAAANSARTRRDPTPTNISSNSLPALRMRNLCVQSCTKKQYAWSTACSISCCTLMPPRRLENYPLNISQTHDHRISAPLQEAGSKITDCKSFFAVPEQRPGTGARWQQEDMHCLSATAGVAQATTSGTALVFTFKFKINGW